MVLVPLRYNNGRRVSKQKLNMTLREIADRFRAESHSYLEKIVGEERGRRREPFCSIWTDTYDLSRNDRWFWRFKRVLEERFKQREIYVTKLGRAGLTVL
jgi:hypothetical protein